MQKIHTAILSEIAQLEQLIQKQEEPQITQPGTIPYFIREQARQFHEALISKNPPYLGLIASDH